MKLTIHTDGFDGYMERSRARAEKWARGESVEPSFGFTFESPQQMFEVLSAERVRVVETARTKPYSVTELARGRDEQGNLVIVDYKTGALPNRNYDAQTFANTELYAALCREKLGETPTKIRLLYVAQGETIERPVTDVVIKARTTGAVAAWDKIKRYYVDGDFPATPSTNTCRFCAYKDLCRANGVPVPVR